MPVKCSKRRRGCEACSGAGKCGGVDGEANSTSTPDLRSSSAKGVNMTKQEIVDAVVKRLYPGAVRPGFSRNNPSPMSAMTSCTCVPHRRLENSFFEHCESVKEDHVATETRQSNEDWSRFLASDVVAKTCHLPAESQDLYSSQTCDNESSLPSAVTLPHLMELNEEEILGVVRSESSMSEDSLDACERQNARLSFEQDSLETVRQFYTCTTFFFVAVLDYW